MKTVIELRNLKKYFGNERSIVKALKGINLKISEGEFVTIFGPSGCGKSTLMHLIGLLDTPTEGRIIIEGKDSSKLSKKRKNSPTK